MALPRVVRKWQEAMEQWGPATGEKRVKSGPPQKAPPVPAKDTVEIEMKCGESSRRVSVPSNTSEEGLVQLLVSGFGENVRKRWRVITRNLSLREMDEYRLHRGWTYELALPEEPKPPESRPVLGHCAGFKLELRPGGMRSGKHMEGRDGEQTSTRGNDGGDNTR
jgi:hypothetical protein